MKSHDLGEMGQWPVLCIVQPKWWFSIFRFFSFPLCPARQKPNGPVERDREEGSKGFRVSDQWSFHFFDNFSSLRDFLGLDQGVIRKRSQRCSLLIQGSSPQRITPLSDEIWLLTCSLEETAISDFAPVPLCTECCRLLRAKVFKITLMGGRIAFL